MKDKTCNVSDHTHLIENQRKLADYIKTSLWDEIMNIKRERWLWERGNKRSKNKNRT